MYLKSLEISGFKSFARKSVLDFSTPIASIVGPNGSGKSNIAEAFRFVLGEQSIKSLRGKKGEDMIFNGSKEAGRANRASVKVTFDNRTRLLDIDFDEVSIERAVHRDSVNEYFINGTQVRLKDIIEMLAKAHIGSSGHHIISQGEADRILNSSIRERREMIEDALGLKIYQWKRQESEKKLEKTGENIERVESLRREIAPHLKYLKKQVEKVEKAIEMRVELGKLYLDYFKREETYLTEAKKKIAEERRGPAMRMKKLEEELAAAKLVLAQSETKDKKSDDIIRLEEELKRMRAEKEETNRAIGRLEGMADFEARRLRKIEQSAAAASDKTVRLSEIERLNGEIDAEIRSVENAGDLGVLRSAFARVRSLFAEFIRRNKDTIDETAVAEAKKEIERIAAERQALDAKAREILAAEEVLVRQERTLEAEIEKEKDSSRDAEKAVFRIVAEQSEVRGILNGLAGQEEIIHREDEAFKRELQEAYHLAGRPAMDFQNYTPISDDGRVLSPAEIASEERVLQEERRKRIEKVKVRLEDAGSAGGADDIMREYKDTTERDAFLERELADLHASAESLTVLIKDLAERLDVEFKQGVEKINAQFSTFFALMFGGGEAKLQVVKEERRKRTVDLSDELLGEVPLPPEPEEELPEGIDISVSLPRKKIRGLQMLSGGERALTSIALLFAISQVNPPPFIILDETDAALDEANSRKYGDMIESLSKYSQLILITHNRETMSRAGLLYGVTMGADGASKLLSIAFEEAVKVAK